MSFKEWFNYILKRMMWYMETPKSERMELKRKAKEDWSYRWFGLMPFSIKCSLDKVRKDFVRRGNKRKRDLA